MERPGRKEGVAILALLASFGLGLGVAAQAPEVRLQGRVIASDSGTPVRRATVSLIAILSDRTQTEYRAYTDDDGRFEFAALPATAYTVRLIKTGFVTRAVNIPGPLKAGMSHDLKDVTLQRAGVITGQIIDEYGEPAAEVGVTVYRSTYPEPGIRRLVPAGSVRTNDLGQYRIYGLQPGTYFVVAGGTAGATVGGVAMEVELARSVEIRLINVDGVTRPMTTTIGGVPPRPRVPTYYPGTTAVADAGPVVVNAAAESSSVDIRLMPVYFARFHGRVVDSRGQPVRDDWVVVSPAQLSVAGHAGPARAPLSPNGEFMAMNLVPGEYRVEVLATASMEAIAADRTGGASQGRTVAEFASQVITVTEDVNDLTIQTTQGARLVGRVTIDGAPPSASSGLRVRAQPAFTADGPPKQTLTGEASVEPDGAFMILGALGPRLIRVDPMPSGLMLAKVTANGVDVTDDVFDIRGGLVMVDIALTARPAVLTGQVTAVGGRPAPASVIVFSDNARLWSKPGTRHVTMVTPDATGKFTTRPLPAGRYYVVAVEPVEPGSWADPLNLERLRMSATLVTLTEGPSAPVTLVRR